MKDGWNDEDGHPFLPQVPYHFSADLNGDGLSDDAWMLISTYKNFKESCEESRDQLVSLLESIAVKDKTVVGYAATSKSTTVLNYCGIDSSLVSYICDTTPIKHGRLSPGMHIPVRPDHEFHDDYPDYALLFAYNHKSEIFQKEQAFTKQGGRWILYVPEVITL